MDADKFDACARLMLSSVLSSFVVFFSTLSHAEALRPGDVTILWPLKSATAASPAADPIFKTKGDGFCNAPQIDKWEFIFPETLATFEQAVLNKVGDECAADTDLEDQYFGVDDSQLMNGEVHLARLKGLFPSACKTSSWKVAGVRLDPCVNVNRVADKPEKCAGEFRLIVQSFDRDTTGLWLVKDFTIHLIYQIPDLPALIADLKAVAAISKQSEKTYPWDPAFDGGAVLRPHHGLRNEMDQCGGPVSKAMMNMLRKNAKPERLTQMAWMTSSMGIKEWSFGLLEVTEQGKKVAIKKVNEQIYDNFSDSLMMGNKPAINLGFAGGKFGSIYDPLLIASGAKVPANAAGADVQKQHFTRLYNLLNPRITSQFDDIGCTTCHLAPQTLERLKKMYGSVPPGIEVYQAKVWPGFLKDTRTFTHLRNFGYGPQFSLGINPRVVNETDLIVKGLAKKFP